MIIVRREDFREASMWSYVLEEALRKGIINPAQFAQFIEDDGTDATIEFDLEVTNRTIN